MVFPCGSTAWSGGGGSDIGVANYHDGYSWLTRTNLQESFQQKSSDRSTDKVREVLKLDQEMRDLSVQSYWFEGVLEVKEVRVGVPQVQAM
ncbi:hypothetical protein LWI29_033905 [Acer saccharum]|uniref:Uncharacterized protein n=1 Tax=Acer saccharum TaxID=4024 RepID=A0AA39RSB2_ACESA|nr:hypothetical protein LWI29_033905 [Acer saccharum]